jgi:polyhydroxyalkanoate synthesis regulator phasin
LRTAQARLIQATEEIRAGYIDRAQSSVKVLGNTLNKASNILLTGGGTLAMTRDKATELVNDLVQKGEVKREDAQAMIDELVARGKEASTNLLKTLDAQITALNTLVKAIQSNLSTGTEDALKKARQELDALGEQLADVRNRFREAETPVEKSTRRTLEQARKQLAAAQTDLVQAAEKIRAGAVEEAQRLVEASRTALEKASHFLRGDK